MTGAPVIQAQADNPCDVLLRDIVAALVGNQRTCSSVDDQVTSETINFQTGAEIGNEQLQSETTEKKRGIMSSECELTLGLKR